MARDEEESEDTPAAEPDRRECPRRRLLGAAVRLVFFMPFLGMAVGAGAGALGGSLTDVGIDDDFIASLRTRIQPGTSALFALTSDAVIDKVRDAFSEMHPELIHSDLSAEDEGRLRELFAED
jgi:uncharacterized membrane protein